MKLKDFINNYINNEKAMNKLNSLQKLVNRYNDSTLYDIFSILLLFTTSILTTSFLSSMIYIEHEGAKLFLIINVFLIVFFFLSLLFKFINEYILYKKLKIEKLLKKMFNPFCLFSIKKTIKLNKKFKQIKNTEKNNILSIIEIKKEIKSYRHKKHREKFPKEKSNYDKEQYEESENFCYKEIKIVDILEYLLINLNIEDIKNINSGIKTNIFKITLFEQKRLLDIINNKLIEKNMELNNNKEIKKYNKNVLDNLTNENNKVIREL